MIGGILVPRTMNVRLGSNATDPVGPTCHLMSAPVRKRPKRCIAAKCRDGPCVDGSGLARRIFTLRRWSERPCVRPSCAVHMTAGH